MAGIEPPGPNQDDTSRHTMPKTKHPTPNMTRTTVPEGRVGGCGGGGRSNASVGALFWYEVILFSWWWWTVNRRKVFGCQKDG